jgi:hypothetical protein
MLRMCVCYILASSRITRSGSRKTDTSFLRWFYHIDDSQDTTTVRGDPTGWRHTTDRAQHGRLMGLDVRHAVEDIICYS